MTERSKTVDSALSLLYALGDGADGDRTTAGLARSIGVSRTAAARLLATLEAHGFARRSGNGWDLGLGLLALSGRVEPTLRTAAHAALEDLAARFGETALLTVRDGNEAVAVDQVVSTDQIVQVHYRTGTRHPLNVAAHGRALITTANPPGHLISEGELEPGVRGVAAPIIDRLGQPVASIGIVAPIHRFPPIDEVIVAVNAAAAAVGRALAVADDPSLPPGAAPSRLRDPQRPAASAGDTPEGGDHALLPTGG